MNFFMQRRNKLKLIVGAKFAVAVFFLPGLKQSVLNGCNWFYLDLIEEGAKRDLRDLA